MTPRMWAGRTVALVALALWTMGEVVRASMRVARDILAPSHRVAPVVLLVPLRTRSALEVAVVSGLYTLTPGTLTVGIHSNPPSLSVHSMYGRDPEALRAELRCFETRVLRAVRYPEQVEATQP